MQTRADFFLFFFKISNMIPLGLFQIWRNQWILFILPAPPEKLHHDLGAVELSRDRDKPILVLSVALALQTKSLGNPRKKVILCWKKQHFFSLVNNISHVHLLPLHVVKPRGEHEIVGIAAGRVLLHDLLDLLLELPGGVSRPESLPVHDGRGRDRLRDPWATFSQASAGPAHHAEKFVANVRGPDLFRLARGFVDIFNVDRRTIWKERQRMRLPMGSCSSSSNIDPYPFPQLTRKR